MTGSSSGGSDQTIDPIVIQWASIFTYWALLGIIAITDLIAADMAIALALAPIALLIIEAVAKRVAARLMQ